MTSSAIESSIGMQACGTRAGECSNRNFASRRSTSLSYSAWHPVTRRAARSHPHCAPTRSGFRSTSTCSPTCGSSSAASPLNPWPRADQGVGTCVMRSPGSGFNSCSHSRTISRQGCRPVLSTTLKSRRSSVTTSPRNSRSSAGAAPEWSCCGEVAVDHAVQQGRLHRAPRSDRRET